MANYSGVRAELEIRRRDILRRVTRIEGDLRQPHERDWVEQAAEVENDEVLEGLDAMGRAELTQIAGALRRLQDGSYGSCVRCHRPIEDNRLRAIPTASTCVRCAS